MSVFTSMPRQSPPTTPAPASQSGSGTLVRTGRSGVFTYAFLFAIGLHVAVLFVLKNGLSEGPEFAVTSGNTSVEVSLVAAAPAVEEAIPEPVIEPPVEPEVPTPPAVLERPPEPTPLPEAMVEPTLPPIASSRPPAPKKPKPFAAKKPQRTGPVGDGSAAKPGKDATTTHVGPVGDNGKPSYLRNPHPTYPESARQAKQEGVVQLRVKVNADGTVRSVALTRSSGFALLDERALSTVRDRWTFKPARIAGMTVASDVIIPVRFSLRD